MKRIMLALAIVSAFAVPAFAGQHCTTTCRQDGSGICYTDCN